MDLADRRGQPGRWTLFVKAAKRHGIWDGIPICRGVGEGDSQVELDMSGVARISGGERDGMVFEEIEFSSWESSSLGTTEPVQMRVGVEAIALPWRAADGVVVVDRNACATRSGDAWKVLAGLTRRSELTIVVVAEAQRYCALVHPELSVEHLFLMRQGSAWTELHDRFVLFRIPSERDRQTHRWVAVTLGQGLQTFSVSHMSILATMPADRLREVLHCHFPAHPWFMPAPPAPTNPRCPGT